MKPQKRPLDLNYITITKHFVIPLQNKLQWLEEIKMNKYIRLIVTRVLIILILVVIVQGCTKYVPVPYPVNVSIYNNTVIQNNTIKYLNVTQPCNNITNTSAKYILGLIQQIKRCEKNLVSNWNLSECVWEMEKMNETIDDYADDLDDCIDDRDDFEDDLNRCPDKLDDCKDDVADCESDLDDCQDDLGDCDQEVKMDMKKKFNHKTQLIVNSVLVTLLSTVWITLMIATLKFVKTLAELESQYFTNKLLFFSTFLFIFLLYSVLKLIPDIIEAFVKAIKKSYKQIK